MTTEIVTAVSVEPITLSDAKKHLNVSHSADDAYITALITVARLQAEQEAERSFAPQTLRCRASEWGAGIELHRGPVNAVTHVKYYDSNNAQQTLAGAAYYLDRSMLVPVVRATYGYTWPNLYSQRDTIEVVYTAGTWNADAGQQAPKAAIHYMLLLIGSMYENREADAAGAVARMPWAERLLDSTRVVSA